MPFGQIPVLEVDGKIINQSMAISRYIGRLVKLAGSTPEEDLEIDSMVDNFNDVRTSVYFLLTRLVLPVLKNKFISRNRQLCLRTRRGTKREKACSSDERNFAIFVGKTR